LDPDSDGGGNWDGCEDSNQPSNGFFEPNLGETRNDDPSDDKLLLIKLGWADLGKDFDLHLIRPGGTIFGSDGSDCYYSNKTPQWGWTAGNYRCGDPKLDQDCITGCTEEQITLNTLKPGTYSVKVHYYSDHGKGTGSPNISVSLYNTKDRKIINQSFGPPQELKQAQVWDVCTIDWPSGIINPINTVSGGDLEATGYGMIPEK
jgi:hypothetical protein